MTKLLLLIPFLLPSYGFSQQMDNSGDEIFTHSQTVSYMHGYKGRDVLSKPTRIKNYTWKGSVLYLVEESGGGGGWCCTLLPTTSTSTYILLVLVLGSTYYSY